MLLAKCAFAALVFAWLSWLPSAPPILQGQDVTGLSGLLAVLLLAVVVAERRVSLRAPRTVRASLQPRALARPRRTLIVGAGPVGRALATTLAATGGYEVVGFVDDAPEASDDPACRILGPREETTALVQRYAVEEVFVAEPPRWQQDLAETLTMSSPAVRMRVVATAYEALTRAGKVESFGDVALLCLQEKHSSAGDMVKRALDVGLSCVVVVGGAPLMLLVAALVKLTSDGPVLYAQERVGRFGEPFILYKFRTMVTDAEARSGPVLSCGSHDERLTSIGRWLKLFRIDELPQLWNVLRGDMSLVGPRPERPFFVQQFERTIPAYSKRHQVRPGITGLAQVYSGYHTRPEDKLRFDILYVVNQSLALDLAILVKTLAVVALRRY